MADDYDRMTTEEMQRMARVRGIPSSHIAGMVGESLRAYLRDFDLDQEDVARWDAGG